MFHFGPTWDIKDEERMEKLLQGSIALKFWDEFNANFVLLYFSSYSLIKNMTPLSQKCGEKQ